MIKIEFDNVVKSLAGKVDSPRLEGRIIMGYVLKKDDNEIIPKTYTLTIEQHKQLESIIKQRYELLSQHTGRRTFITLLALREWSAHRIKQYSGHSDIEMVERYTKIKDSVEFERFRNAIRNDSSHILRFVDENENNKLFGTVIPATLLCNYPIDRIKFQQEIQEAKEVLAMFGVPAYKFMDSFDIDELRSMMYGIEHNLLKVIKERDVIKAIFNNTNKTLEDKARELHELYLSCKNEN